MTISSDDFMVMGVDPGPRPGIVALRYSSDKIRSAPPVIVQCTANATVLIIQGIAQASGVQRIFLSFEPFVMGNLSGRVSSPAASASTSKLCGILAGLAHGDPRIIIKHHQASAVKIWGCEDRLERAGLALLVRGMTHARDGAKQALYCATHDAGVPDPLSKRHRIAEVMS